MVIIALSALLALASADHPAPYHPAPAYKEVPAAYQYQYAVKDDYSGVNFGADEARDGYATQDPTPLLSPTDDSKP
ncbi:Uncharacterized protein FKW44_000409 [Caligus rogercresseyi]|uniref:Cuticle protein n=1 Tax=Caligus rogercresseyi TaxID=217165 RepID=A0A7T8KHA9_CALRO|nr:Uncharacterized protein FKW44_000409 [Caligus rogercresseyi]